MSDRTCAFGLVQDGFTDEEPFLPVRVNITKKAADGTLQVMELDCGVDGNASEWVIEGVRLESPDVPEDSIAYSGPDY